MKKKVVHKILVPMLVVLSASQGVTALFHTRLSHEVFEIFHQGSGTILIGLIILHFILNFKWVKASYFHK